MQVSYEAKLKGLSQSVGVIYDDLARRKWSEMATAGVCGFSVNVACRSLDESVLRLAEAECLRRSGDNRSQNNQADNNAKGQGKHWSKRSADQSWQQRYGKKAR